MRKDCTKCNRDDDVLVYKAVPAHTDYAIMCYGCMHWTGMNEDDSVCSEYDLYRTDGGKWGIQGSLSEVDDIHNSCVEEGYQKWIDKVTRQEIAGDE